MRALALTACLLLGACAGTPKPPTALVPFPVPCKSKELEKAQAERPDPKIETVKDALRATDNIQVKVAILLDALTGYAERLGEYQAAQQACVLPTS